MCRPGWKAVSRSSPNCRACRRHVRLATVFTRGGCRAMSCDSNDPLAPRSSSRRPGWSRPVLILAPLRPVVLAYSLLTRGAYGGMTLPWTGEQLRAPLGSALSGAFLAGLSGLPAFPLYSVCCWVFRWRCFWRAPEPQESVFEPGDPAVLDQLSGAHLRVDVSAARHRTDQQHASVAGSGYTIRFRCSTTMAR